MSSYVNINGKKKYIIVLLPLVLLYLSSVILLRVERNFV